MAALYLTHDNGILGKKGEALSFRRSRAEKAETIPPAMIEQVMVLGRGSVTTPALHLLLENDVPVHFIDERGRYKGSLTSGRGRGYAAKRLQFEAAASEERTLAVARSVVAGTPSGAWRGLAPQRIFPCSGGRCPLPGPSSRGRVDRPGIRSTRCSPLGTRCSCRTSWGRPV